ncbi:transcriptional repressor CTCFL [Sabethes cyaneus]|uniref:transcriptional repressor CTCFL n=1 Tax=Sabethes cyaneus TaxID=53552 RepID=UPI00237DCC4E|nr:transcriptional repressor CTCFL [Sabethes cyaneus]
MQYVMDNEVILIEDDWEQQLPKPQPVPVARPGPSRRRRASKRSSNGTIIPSQSLPATGSVAHENVLVHELPAISDIAAPAVIATDQFDSVIVDGQDVFIIQELDEESSQPQPPVFEVESDEGLVDFKPSTEEITSSKDDYYDVDPLELSDIWNDLITANQEILILLELQDLKHHIVDARCIEDQMQNMLCEYCPRVLPNIRTWNQHIKKVHFQTEQFECDSCDGTFKYFARYRDHIYGHVGERPYQCDECNHQYAYRIGFLVHKILDHIKLNGVYVCPQCRVDCKDAQNYKLHIAKHIDSAPHTAATVPLDGTRASSQRNSQTRAPVLHSQANERNKFLNAYESFSKELKKGFQPVEKPGKPGKRK